MQLTEHFTYEEMTYSETAIRKNYNNTPDNTARNNLVVLCSHLLEPLRSIFNVPIKINSGYRSLQVNAAVGGVDTSQHTKGQAADTVAIGLSVKNYYQRIKELVRTGQISVDQCIYEYNSWVHLSYNEGHNRNQFLIKEYGKPYVRDES